MLIHLLASAAPDERRAVVAYLAAAAQGGPGGMAPEDLLDLMVGHGSLDFAFQFGQGVAAAAYESFHQAFADMPPSPHRDFVEALIPYMLERPT